MTKNQDKLKRHTEKKQITLNNETKTSQTNLEMTDNRIDTQIL